MQDDSALLVTWSPVINTTKRDAVLRRSYRKKQKEKEQQFMEAVLPISTKEKKKRAISTHTLRSVECVRSRKTKKKNTRAYNRSGSGTNRQTIKQRKVKKKKTKSEVLTPVVVFHDFTLFFFMRWNTLYYTLTNSVKLLRNVKKNKTIKHTLFSSFFGLVA